MSRVFPRAARFDLEDVQEASDSWGFNCGPGALCAVLSMTPAEIRPHLLDFEDKGYTNPSLMAAILRGLSVPFRRTFESVVEPAPEAVRWPEFGLVRVQWAGPWTKSGVPIRARYRASHWVGCRSGPDGIELFDVNAMCVGGWLSLNEWSVGLVPWLLEQCVPKADGRWWPTHCWDVLESEGGRLGCRMRH